MFRWAAVLLLLGAACSKVTPAEVRERAFAVAPPQQKVFRYAGVGGEFFDPARIGDTAAHQLMLNVFEGLYGYALGDGEPVAAMAEGCTVDAAAVLWTCTLRSGITWSDGVPITAADFVYSWRRVLDPKTASRSAQLLWFIEGAKAFNDGRTTDPEKVAVWAEDPRTLRVRLVAPTPFFRHLLAEMPYAPVPRHVIEKHGVQWTRPQHIVSNGPYLLAEHRRRSLVVLKKNLRYFDASNVYIERIEAHSTESEKTAFDWYEVGKIDWTGDLTLPPDRLADLAKSGRTDMHRDPYLCTYYYAFANTKPPFDDVRVRRAFDLAIDRERLLLHVLNSGAQSAAGVVPDLFGETHNYRTPRRRTFDPVAARKLLAEAGFPHGLGLPPVELTFNTADFHRVVAEFVQRSLLEQLGVKVVLANMEWKTLLKRMRAGDFEMSRSGWCADYPDPLTFLEVFHSDSSANYSGFDDAKYDALVERIRAERHHGTRNHLIRAAEELLARQRPMLPIFHYSRAYMLRPWVLGFAPQMQDFHPFKYLRFASGQRWQQMREAGVSTR